MSNIQRTIFSLPEETSPADILEAILKENGVEDKDFLEGNVDKSKLLFVGKSAKDFFDKKISESEMLKIFQEQLGMTQNQASGVIAGLKEKLLPFAQRITVQEKELEEETMPLPEGAGAEINLPKETVKPEEIRMPSESTMEPARPAAPSFTKPQSQEKIRRAQPQEAVKKSPEPKAIPDIPKPKQKKSSGPDKYRESIE